MKYAVNIADLTKDEIVSLFMVMPVCPNKIIINVDKKRLDEMAVVLECDETRAIPIIEMIRIKYPSVNLFRCYMSKSGKGGWKRI